MIEVDDGRVLYMSESACPVDLANPTLLKNVSMLSDMRLYSQPIIFAFVDPPARTSQWPADC